MTEAKAGIGATEERISFIHIQTPLNKTKAVFIDDSDYAEEADITV